MNRMVIQRLKDEYNSILLGYLTSGESSLQSYIDNLPHEKRQRMYRLEELLRGIK